MLTYHTTHLRYDDDVDNLKYMFTNGSYHVNCKIYKLCLRLNLIRLMIKIG